MTTEMRSAIVLICNRCEHLFTAGGKSLHWTAEQARARAQRRGWIADEGEDFCEPCQKKGALV